MATKVFVGQNNQVRDHGFLFGFDDLPTVVDRRGGNVYFLFNRKYYQDITKICDITITKDGMTLKPPEEFENNLSGQIHATIFKLAKLIEEVFYRDVTLDFVDETADIDEGLKLYAGNSGVILSLSRLAQKELLRTLANIGYDMAKFDLESISKALSSSALPEPLVTIEGSQMIDDGKNGIRLAALFAVLDAYSKMCPSQDSIKHSEEE